MDSLSTLCDLPLERIASFLSVRDARRLAAASPALWHRRNLLAAAAEPIAITEHDLRTKLHTAAEWRHRAAALTVLQDRGDTARAHCTTPDTRADAP